MLTALVRWNQDARGRTFGDELRARGQSSRAVECFWDVFIRPALNLPTREAGADYGVFTVQTALLAGPRASDLLLPIEPLYPRVPPAPVRLAAWSRTSPCPTRCGSR